MNNIVKQNRSFHGLLGVLLVAGSLLARADAGELIETEQTAYGTFAGVDYVRHAGRFVGTTSRGDYRVPYELVAPANKRSGNGTVVFEAPHFAFGAAGRDVVLGEEILFNRRYSHATVGFSNQGLNMLDPAAADFVVAGLPVGPDEFPFPRDVEILKQFAIALKSDPTAQAALGRVQRRYAYGLSQSAEALYELAYGPGAGRLFDLTVLHVPLWRPAFARPDTLAVLPEIFEPLQDIGKVMLVSAEGDLLISQSLQLRNASENPNYRLYEVAGAPHLFQDIVIDGVRTNPLDVAPVVRAAFVAGNRWVRRNYRPPRSRLLEAAAPGELDPIYMFPTGIRRDANGNAAGGVRFPDVENGRALHIASLLDVEVIPGLPGLIGVWFDLACAPEPGSTTGLPRFTSHRDYVRSVWQQAFRLLWHGYLLPKDALQIIRDAKESDVGKPEFCMPMT